MWLKATNDFGFETNLKNQERKVEITMILIILFIYIIFIYILRKK